MRQDDLQGARDRNISGAYSAPTLTSIEDRRVRRLIKAELLDAELMLKEYGLPVPLPPQQFKRA